MFPAHLDTWVQTSPTPRTDVPVAPFLHGIASAPPDVTVVWRDLPDEAPQQVLAVQALPPSADEAIEVPVSAVRRWLARSTESADLPDLEGGHGDGVPDTSPDSQSRVVRYVDRNTASLIAPGQIRPGDLIVVPATCGGCDRYGWNPAAAGPVVDVADLVGNPSRQATIRLGHTLLSAVTEHDADFARRLRPLIEQVAEDLSGDDLQDPRHYLAKIRAILPATAVTTEPLQPHLAILRRLVSSSTPALTEHRKFGWVMLTGDKAAYAEDTGVQASSAAREPVSLMPHQRAVQVRASEFARNLGFDEAAITAVGLAALWHDEGKRDPRFQVMLHGGDRVAATIADEPLAKSGLSPLDRRAFTRARQQAGYPHGMRHEALSAQIASHLLDAHPSVDRDLVLHLIASHHGRSRPLLPPVTDPDPVTSVDGPGGAEKLEVDTSRSIDWSASTRFASLNDRYGRWGLARLEAVVRLADIWCSARGEKLHDPLSESYTIRPKLTAPATRPATTVELPALDGRDPLGFLAALGLMRILTEAADTHARLAFSKESGCAILESPLTSTEEISHALGRVVAAIPDGSIIPLAVPGFPPPASSGKDPLRPARTSFRTLITELGETSAQTINAWLSCLVTDLAMDKQGRVGLTPFTAPSGQQKIRTFFEKPLQAVAAQPGFLHEALTGWRRIDGFTGEYLDHRVLRSAADDAEGRTGQEAGVPGATWLATMALPLLRHVGDGTWPRTVLWHRTQRREIMLWPLWRDQLDLHAIKCLLDHPVFQQATPTPTSQDLAPLGVFTICGAERQRIPGRNFDGVLAPITSPVR
jgi:CRISPR-associated endonuclease/helicase Cas3